MQDMESLKQPCKIHNRVKCEAKSNVKSFAENVMVGDDFIDES